MPEKPPKQESPIKASADAKATLARLADQFGIRKIDLLDQAVKAMADHVAHHGERLLLPLRFTETFSVTTLDPTKPLILHEPPTVRLKVERSGDAGRTYKRPQKATARG